MMNFKSSAPVAHIERSERPRGRQRVVHVIFVIGLLAMLAACGSDDRPAVGVIGNVRGFFGGVVAEEPRAALVARDILSAGGSAGDAAVALYFVLAATLPSSASLGGGGVCLIYDVRTQKVEALDFLPRRSSARGGAVAAVGIPGSVRGMAVVHARLGILPWSQLVFPGERLARFGAPTSRAFARALAAARTKIADDPGARHFFKDGSNAVLGEGERLEQLDLSTILGQIRARGAGAFYQGDVASRYVNGIRTLGGTASREAQRAYRPRLLAPVRSKIGVHELYLLPKALDGGDSAGLWQALGVDGAYSSAGAEERPVVLARAFGQQAPAQAISNTGIGGRWPVAGAVGLPGQVDGLRAKTDIAQGFAATSFAVADRTGNLVSCAVTSGAAFGTGRIVPGTGIFAGWGVAPGSRAAGTEMALALVANENTKQPFMAIAAAGADAAPSVMTVMLRAFAGGATLDEVLREWRVGRAGPDGAVAVESTAPPGVGQALTRAGMAVRKATPIGRVSAIFCADGLIRTPGSCTAVADPRGNGLGVSPE